MFGTLNYVVEQTTVVSGDILDIAEVFEASLDFERGDARINHLS